MEQLIYDEECFRGARARPARLLGHRHGRPDADRVGHRGAEAALPAPHPARPTTSGARASPSPAPARIWPALRTRAEDDGDHFVVNGQKVWTLGRPVRRLDAICSCAPIPTAPKHRGISYLLVDMKTPGITVRPLVLDDRRTSSSTRCSSTTWPCPRRTSSARSNQGWKVAMTTLMYERKARRRPRPRRPARAARRARPARSKVDGAPAWDSPLVRQRLAQLAIEAAAFKYTRLPQPDAPAPRRAARARGLDPEALRLRAGRAHRGLRGRAARPPRAREPAERGRARRARAGSTAW